jgi:hypothetical protein
MGLEEYSKTFPYHGWDAKKTRGCVCDATYSDIDCSKKMCPYGTDVLDTRDNLLVSQKYQTQNIYLLSGRANYEFDDDEPGGYIFNGKTIALTFKSKLNETFTTIPINLKFDESPSTKFQHDLANDIELALMSLPNKVIDGVKVAAQTIHAGYSGEGTTDANEGLGAAISINITFTGDAVQGAQHLIAVEDYECYIGCTPQITGVDLWNRGVLWGENSHLYQSSNITDVTPDGVTDFNSYECGRRGKCDYSSGQCQCFTGYTGDNCNTLSTLV